MQIGRHRVALVAVSFLIVAFTLAGRLIGDEGQREQTYDDLATFTEVLHLVDTSYVDQVAENDLMAGAFRGMLASLDPHSGWLSPEETQAILEANPDWIDAGVETTKRGGYAFVMGVLPGSPAEKAGIEVGEYIRTIDGRTTREMSDLQVRHGLSGPADAQLHLNLFGDHEGREIDVTLVPYEIQPIDSTLDPGGVLVVTVRTLRPATVTALGELLRQPPEGTEKVLLDLRNLVFGKEEDAISLADLFLDSGVIVRIDERGHDERVVQATDGKSWGGDLALLVNRFSAGAAELVSAALSRNGRAEILGENTFGDASLQRLIKLPDESSLILSVGRYLPPAGDTWHEDGIHPDVTIDAGEDSEEVATANGEEVEEPESELTPSDEQLQRAVDYLAGRLDLEQAA
jgi:carboxyl-terminal processing protease